LAAVLKSKLPDLVCPEMDVESYFSDQRLATKTEVFTEASTAAWLVEELEPYALR
jgi:hypothetical protein